MSDKQPPSSPGPVWSKRVGDAAVARANVEYCAGFDVVGRPAADARLASWDLCTNAAHMMMLAETQIIPPAAAKALAGGLVQLRRKLEADENLIRPACEDIHMSVESILGELIGEDAAGHLHTARSRNDQIATDMRLWLREEIVHFVESINELAIAIAEHARAHLKTVCPGFTHGQPGMVTSWGHWTMSYLPRLLRDARALNALLRDLATCPLGAAASYGTSWPIDRERTATLLGFAHPAPSGADAIWARGEIESRFASALAHFLAHLAGISQDLINLSTPPREWVRLADEHVTGSSIMPQKRNPDFAEVTRARAAHAAGIAQSLLGIVSMLPSGYNRDTQWTKYLVFDAADNADNAAPIFADVFRRLRVNEKAMRAACDQGFLNATDVADFLARARKLPFRQCYRVVGAAVRACDEVGRLTLAAFNRELEIQGIAALTADEWRPLEEPQGLLLARRQPGNPHPDETAASIDLLLREIADEAANATGRAAKWRAALTQLWRQLAQMAG